MAKEDTIDTITDSGFKRWGKKAVVGAALLGAFAVGTVAGSVAHTVGNWVNPDYAAGGERFSAHALSLTKGEIYEIQGGNPSDKTHCYFDGRQLLEVEGIKRDGELTLGKPCLIPEGYGPLAKAVVPAASAATGYEAATPAEK
jgi:hypothetical protein